MSTASPKPIGFALYGLGLIADFYARALAEVKGARLVAVGNRSADKGRAFAQKYGVAFAGTDPAELAVRPGVDVVCITTSSGAHLEPSLAAIRAGKHLVIEKPVEITTERVDRVLTAARAAGVTVAAIFQGRFGEGPRAVRAAIEQGRLGRLVLASAYVKWHRTPEYYRKPTRGSLAADGGGALMNQAIHAIDLLQWFAGMPAEVFCSMTRRVYEQIEAEDTASATVKFANGALGAIEASTALWPGWRRRLEICGEHGSIVLEEDVITRWEFREARPEDAAIRAAQGGAALGSGASAPNAISIVGHQRQLQDLVDALRAGRAPALSGDEGRKAVAIVCSLYQSAREGRPVRL